MNANHSEQHVPRPPSLWGGRILACIGIIFYSFSLRSAVASFSPLVSYVRADFPISGLTLGLIGAAPLICYAFFGLLTPAVERRIGLPRLAGIAMLACTFGHLARGLSTSEGTLLFANILVFASLGVANILIPGLVKEYFPDRIGTMTAIYVTIMAFSTMLPAALAVPVAEVTNWRTSIGLWSGFALLAFIPWAMLSSREKKSSRIHRPSNDQPRATTATSNNLFIRIIKLPLTWALTATFAISSGIAYSMFAWLPEILSDLVDFTAGQSGNMLAIFTFGAVVTSAIVPILITRFHLTLPLSMVSMFCGFIAISGFVFAPAWNTWLWVVLLNLSTTTFPICMVLLGLRTRSATTSVALSGIVQSGGYLIGAIFPIAFGILNDLTGSWKPAFILLSALLFVGVPALIVVSRSITVEEQWEKRTGKKWSSEN